MVVKGIKQAASTRRHSFQLSTHYHGVATGEPDHPTEVPLQRVTL